MPQSALNVIDEPGQMAMRIEASLALWSLPANAAARLINISENVTYLVEAPGGFKSVLRVHRPHYHTRRAIESELAWSQAMRREGLILTPEYLIGRNGDPVQTVEISGPADLRHMVMFEYVDGKEPRSDQNLAGLFAYLGESAAKMHNYASQWQKPEGFERFSWNIESVFGALPLWGNWRDGPYIGRADLEILQRLEDVVIERLSAFGQTSDRYGLIHADMRLANLLVKGVDIHIIDFDDCGMGWHLYDFAAAISFMEDSPQIPALKEIWVQGYRKIRDLPQRDYEELDSFIMLRRMALLAWMGTHAQVDIAKELSASFCQNTVMLANAYLDKMA